MGNKINIYLGSPLKVPDDIGTRNAKTEKIK